MRVDESSPEERETGVEGYYVVRRSQRNSERFPIESLSHDSY